MKIIVNEVSATVKKYSNRNAFYIKGNNYTYKVLEECIGGISKEILCHTRGISQCIGIVESDNIETYASVLAVLITGNAYVILNPHNPISRNKEIIGLTNLEIILNSEATLLDLNSVNTRIINTEGLKSPYGIEDMCFFPDDNLLAYIIFTSGSTGKPKGVPISHKNLNAFYNAYSNLNLELNGNDKMLQMFDLCFDVSVVSMLYPLTIGACIYTISQNSVKYTQVYELLEDEELSFAAIPPSLLSYLQPYFEEIHLPKLKYLILTAEASNWELLSQFTTCVPNAELINLYGPTEATIYCTCYRVEPDKVDTYNGMLAIGKAFPNISVKILDKSLNEVLKGEKGELCVAGAQVMSGYWNDPKKSKEVFITLDYFDTPTEFYRTGDLCFEDEKGCIHYCGRIDNQVQIQGFRVELNEIEHTVRQYHTKGNNIVTVVPNQLGNHELHLFLENFKSDHVHLLSFLKEKLPLYMCPNKIHDLHEFPVNTSGKIDRKKLQELILQ